MRVLVIIPTHDRLQFLDEAIASVKAQTRPADELIITGNVGLGIITDAPLADRLNAAIAQSDCDAFAMLSDDDTLAPHFLEQTVAAMEERQCDIVYTDCRMFEDQDGIGCALGEWTEANINRNTVPLATSLCSRQAWERAGGFENVPFYDWFYWWKCFYTEASAYYLRRPLWNYRRHAGQAGNSQDMDAQRLQVMELMAQRKPFLQSL
jgi:GT2 family glycosyltransferase